MSSRFDDDASPSGQRAASRSTASLAPGERGKVLAVGRGEALDHLAVDLLRRLGQADLLVHVARPLCRAHAHHVLLRLVVPAAAALLGELLAGLVPDLLGVEQQAVEIEDDRLDHSAA